MTDQHETPEFRPVGDEWEKCKEPDGAPLELRKLGGTWWRLGASEPVLMAHHDGMGCVMYHENHKSVIPYPGKKWGYYRTNCVSDRSPWDWVTRYYVMATPLSAEYRRVQVLRELPDLVMQRLAEARHKHPEPQSLRTRLVALKSELLEAFDAMQMNEGTDRIKDELLDVITVAVRALSEEWAS